MIRRKSNFLTFCCALMPGAGQMYMGFMKRGVSLMSGFFLLIFISSWLNLSPLLYALPIIWFFAFFDTFHLHGLTDEEFAAAKDEFIFIPQIHMSRVLSNQKKYRSIFAIVLIIIGATVLWNNVFDLFGYLVPRSIYGLRYYFPQLLIGCVIIALGLYLIRGKKKELDIKEEESILEDKGGI